MPLAVFALAIMPVPSTQPQDLTSAMELPSTQSVVTIPSSAAATANSPLPPPPTLPPAPDADRDASNTAMPPAEQTSVQPQADQPVVPAEDADLVVTARATIPGDPMQAVNVASFNATQAVDDAVTAPIAHAFERTVPSPVRSGLRNLLSNLHEPVVFINFLLQHKIGKAAETLGRFAINSTIGLAGVIDVARRRPFNLPRRPNGLADTLGFYGVGPGPFIYVPLVGPTTVRDLIGRGADGFLLPNVVGSPFGRPAYTIPTAAVRAIDSRAESDERIRLRRESGVDQYSSARDAYLRDRQIEIDRLRCGRDDCSTPPPLASVDTSPPRR